MKIGGVELPILQLLGGRGGWYPRRGGNRAALVPVRWACVLDPAGGREDYFYTADPSPAPEQIVQTFAHLRTSDSNVLLCW